MWPEREKITQATWTSPVTNRLLFEAGFSSFSSKWGGYVPPGSQTGLVAVTEQSTAAGVPVPNFTYHGWSSAASNNQQHNIWRASMAYVTGAHSFKVGSRRPTRCTGSSRTWTTSWPTRSTTARPTPVHDADRPAHAEQPHALRRLLRAGSVDARPAHAAGRAALRARVELVPRGRERHHCRQPVRQPLHLPGAERRHRLPRHHAAHGRCLRRVRQRQDVAEGEHQQIPGDRAERRASTPRTIRR